MAENIKLEKMAHSIEIVYELMDKVEAGKETKALMSALTHGHSEKFSELQDEYTYKWVVGDERYKQAISTLQTEFGNIDSVKDILEKVYTKCPSLRPVECQSLRPKK